MPIEPTALDTLEDYLEAVQSVYDACPPHADHAYTIEGKEATVRLHYLKFDGDGRPKAKALTQAPVDHITLLCIASYQRPSVNRAIADPSALRKASPIARTLRSVADVTFQARQQA